MNRKDFISKLSQELDKQKIGDKEEILGEYEQHFDFKSADGYTEEEISAKLGDPVLLASQFDTNETISSGPGKKLLIFTGLFFLDLLAGAFLICLIVWEILMAALSVSCFVMSGYLMTASRAFAFLPVMPYPAALSFGAAFLALGVISVIGTVYFYSLIRQLFRAYGRCHSNAIRSAQGSPSLPSIPIAPGKKRIMRTVSIISILVFIVLILFSGILSMILSGSLEFWHAWGWFGYGAA